MAVHKEREPGLNKRILLKAASTEFASRGLQGARLDVIAREAEITRAMIYYYFGGREGLYLAALEDNYRDIREAENALDLEGLSPVEAMRKLTFFRVDYYVRNPDFVTLVAIENQNAAGFLKLSKEIIPSSRSSLAPLAATLKRGQQDGVFREAVDLVELHQIMVSIGMFNVSNRHTFGAVFSRDLSSPARLRRTRALAFDVVSSFLRPVEADEER